MGTNEVSKVSLQLKTHGLQESLIKECRIMMEYCLANGKNIDASQVAALEKEDKDITAQELLPVYNYLVGQVKPATPGTLVLFEKNRQSKALFKFLGPLPIVRRFMMVTIISLVALILISLSPHVNATSIQLSMLQGFGWDQVQRLAFLLACASVGASFYALFKMNNYISQGTFDMKYSSTYWSRFVLGLVAGILLSEMFVVFIDSGASMDMNDIPPHLGEAGAAADSTATAAGAADTTATASNLPNNGVADTNTNTQESVGFDKMGLDETNPLSSAQYLLKPILAILGGFSANLVYRILNRLIEAVESLFKGSAEEIVAQKQQQLAMQNLERENNLRTTTAQQLLSLKNDLIGGNVPPEILSKVDNAIGGLVSVPLAKSSADASTEEPAQTDGAPATEGTPPADPPASTEDASADNTGDKPDDDPNKTGDSPASW